MRNLFYILCLFLSIFSFHMVHFWAGVDSFTFFFINSHYSIKPIAFVCYFRVKSFFLVSSMNKWWVRGQKYSSINFHIYFSFVVCRFHFGYIVHLCHAVPRITAPENILIWMVVRARILPRCDMEIWNMYCQPWKISTTTIYRTRSKYHLHIHHRLFAATVVVAIVIVIAVDIEK